MSVSEKIQQLLTGCKCGVYIGLNQHRDYYKKVEQILDELHEADFNNIPPEIRTRMIETDSVVDIHFYTSEPVGSHQIYHYDLDAALSLALQSL